MWHRKQIFIFHINYTWEAAAGLALISLCWLDLIYNQPIMQPATLVEFATVDLKQTESYWDTFFVFTAWLLFLMGHASIQAPPFLSQAWQSWYTFYNSKCVQLTARGHCHGAMIVSVDSFLTKQNSWRHLSPAFNFPTTSKLVKHNDHLLSLFHFGLADLLQEQLELFTDC